MSNSVPPAKHPGVALPTGALPAGTLPTGALPDCVGVLGGGRMGAGIAHAFLVNGADVLVVERDEESAAAARQRVEAAVAKSIERGATDASLDALVSRLSVTADYDDFKDRQLVIEAVPEDWDLKVSSLRGIEERLAADAYLASNTSSLSVNGLAGELARPQNFLGLHFFNPVPASTLIEVVLGEHTSEQLARAARGWVAALGKTAVVVNDAPGFASSRLGVAIALEAMRMVEEGVASAEDIDNAMVLGYKHPTGPLRTTDIVGLDVRLGIAEYLASTLGERFAPPQILRDKVARGELGRKTGKGFFEWTD
jgi:3-hydroxybutyryl-CoA dehydrogenase